ncbi:hypothetical protein [Lactococcus sp. UBA7157]|uniref:hypothetical protein n=1 Tax=Lactococcus sp. UBA7157 TaxID=1946734 RepID=UPI00257B8C24|nr:hypothetical protein [Lactococcus sp. UBA7157]
MTEAIKIICIEELASAFNVVQYCTQDAGQTRAFMSITERVRLVYLIILWLGKKLLLLFPLWI